MYNICIPTYRQLNHYLLTTYKIISDLESAQAEHRRRPKHEVRSTGKEYVNTVEFVRLVAEIVAGNILNAVCGGQKDSPKAVDDDDLAKRLLNEFSSQINTAGGGTSELQFTHGDHIRLGVANAVAEMFNAAKRTGGLPGTDYAANSTALSAEAEAQRRQRGILAARSLASGKLNYNYCDSGKSNPRVQASRNKKFPNFEGRKSNHRHTDGAAVAEKQTSSDGVKSGANSRAVTRVLGRPKPDISLLGGKDSQRTTSAQNVTRKVQLEKTISTRTDKGRSVNVTRNSYAFKMDARKTVGESRVPNKSKNINVAMKSRERIPRQPLVGNDTVNNTRSRQQRGAVRGRVTIQLPKDVVTRRKQVVASESKTGTLVRTGTRKPNSNAVNPTSNNMNGKARGTAANNVQKKIIDPVTVAGTTDKIRKSGPTGTLPKIGGTSGPRRKPSLANVERSDDKHEKSISSKRTILGDNGVGEKSKSPRTRNENAAVEKSKTSRTINSGAVVKKSKTLRTKNGSTVVEKSKIPRTRNDGAILEKSKTSVTRKGDTAGTMEKPKTTRTKNDVAEVEKSKNTRTGNDFDKPERDGKRDVTAPSSEILISPAVDYNDDASLTAARDGINEPMETKRTAAEAIGGPRASAVVRDNDGVKNALNQDTRKDHGVDERDPVKTKGDLVETIRDRVENRADKLSYNAKTGADNAETGAENSEIGQENVNTERNRVDEPNQKETRHKTTKSMAADQAGSRNTEDVCNNDSDLYKLRVSCVVGPSDQCQNQHTGLYQATKICSKYEVKNLTEEEYCKIKNTFDKQINK
ncbi:hypothetical protein AGLY_004807 [Aphis glycines]|uniref:Uncharacterized protein n=1 Tax=Aphis glycines TaxID=307491 RepID=A0A6G0TUX2_APHGL|nr:hypothetical protein AGLY_004807 [Aphis glycines]